MAKAQPKNSAFERKQTLWPHVLVVHPGNIYSRKLLLQSTRCSWLRWPIKITQGVYSTPPLSGKKISSVQKSTVLIRLVQECLIGVRSPVGSLATGIVSTLLLGLSTLQKTFYCSSWLCQKHLFIGSLASAHSRTEPAVESTDEHPMFGIFSPVSCNNLILSCKLYDAHIYM